MINFQEQAEDGGAYVVVAEWRGQGPIVMETEGQQSSRDGARQRVLGNNQLHRYCICRLVPVEGNELVLKDLERLQR